jgi:hypothetical protein
MPQPVLPASRVAQLSLSASQRKAERLETHIKLGLALSLSTAKTKKQVAAGWQQPA